MSDPVFPRLTDVDPVDEGADRRDLIAAWAAGLVAALAVVGPGLRSGAWMNVDLLITPVTPVPSGVWALGPDLPRRVPFAVPFAWLSSVAPGELPWKLAVVAALASTAAGTWRLVSRWDRASPPIARLGAALLAGVGPFAVTRAGAGHLGLTFALAVLPWALPTLLRPADRPARTALWAAALGCAGPFGGTLALPVVAIGLLASGSWRRAARRAAVRAAVATVVAQGPWLVPTLVVAAFGTDVASAGDFPTSTTGAGGLVRLLAGHGFWHTTSQIGRTQGWEVPMAGVATLALALAGRRRIPERWRRSAVAVAAVGLVGAASVAIPGVGRVTARLVDLPVLVALREPQRLLALYLVVAAPAAALGAVRLARAAQGVVGDVVASLPLAVSVIVVLPGLWGASGAFDPVAIPAGWAEARDAVRAAPGPVMVVPWSSYPRLAIADGRQVVQPLRIYLGGDVLTSSDAGFGDGRRERSDPREPVADDLARRMGQGQPVADDLARLGVRWVVRIPVLARGSGVFPGDPGLRMVLDRQDVTLYEVEGWAGARRSVSGEVAPVDRPVAPVMAVDGRARVSVAGTPGWWRGASRATTASDGLLEVPGGSSPVWYPAAVLALAADAAVVVMVLVAARRLRSFTGRGHRLTEVVDRADGLG